MKIRVMWRDMASGEWESLVLDMDDFEEWWGGVGMQQGVVRVRQVWPGEETGGYGEGGDD